MADDNSTKKGPLPLGQVVKEIDASLLDIDDTEALRLGMAALTGVDSGAKGERFVLFSIGKALMAVAIAGVAEVGDMPIITRVPNVPSWVQGVVNVRSEIVSVVDLLKFIEWDAYGAGSGNKMIILGQEKIKVGFRIDQMLGTLNKNDDTEIITDNPLAGTAGAQFLAQGLVADKQIFYSLDYEALLTNDRFVKLKD